MTAKIEYNEGMHPLERFFAEVGDIHTSGAGVAETSFYPALANLVDAIGSELKPKVRCIINLANRGAGIPDGGFFTAEQFSRGKAAPWEGVLPNRGAVEAKPPARDLNEVIASDQARNYCGRYGLLLVTNLREWVLLRKDEKGPPTQMESYQFAPDELSFWSMLAHPRAAAEKHSFRFTEYLKRVLLTLAPLADPADLAWFLASYARDALARVESADVPALDEVRKALSQALGMSFSGPKGEHFFRSTLVQTIFYGVFSAWVMWCRTLPQRQGEFTWRQAQWIIAVPFIRTRDIVNCCGRETERILRPVTFSGGI
ncbi:MAG: hypothetical protein NT005_03750 [Spirochaetes bacterium]|nr:hypothetical protein [Spirochaetota bacterium]